MLQARQDAAQAVARQELRQFLSMAESVGMDTETQRRSLRLSHEEWQRWQGILHDAPLPQSPALPLLLRHIGYLTNRLDRAERRTVTYN